MEYFPRELIHLILLYLKDAKVYYRLARQLCRYTRSMVGHHVKIRIVNCFHENADSSATFRSVVWKNQLHPHDVIVSTPYILYHGCGYYRINGTVYEFSKTKCKCSDVVFFKESFYVIGSRIRPMDLPVIHDGTEHCIIQKVQIKIKNLYL